MDTRSSGPAAANPEQGHSEKSTSTNQDSTATVSFIGGGGGGGGAADFSEVSLTLLTANNINSAEIAC